MSKEKNLTFMYGNRVVSESAMACKRCHGDLGMVTFGPAIDRLHEFEKLGMEPEEIERKLKDYKVAMNRVYGLANEKEALTKGYTVTVEEYCTRINEKNEEIAELERRLKNVQHINNVCTNSITDMRHEIDTLTKANDELRSMNQKQYDNIAELQKEIAEREKVEGASYGEIGRLSELVRLQRNAIDGYVDSNADLRKKLSRSVESNKALQKQIEYYQDKLKEINRVLEED